MTQATRRWRVEPLDGQRHDRSAFTCGAPELDRYIREQATQDMRRNIARVFVALDPGLTVVQGYYSLSAASFAKQGPPAAEARRLPHYPIPAVLLGRLAVDAGTRGRGLGAHLLMDALDRIDRASQLLAVHAIIVDARDKAAELFYRKFGFMPLVDDDRRLFLLMATLRQLTSRQLPAP